MKSSERFKRFNQSILRSKAEEESRWFDTRVQAYWTEFKLKKKFLDGKAGGDMEVLRLYSSRTIAHAIGSDVIGLPCFILVAAILMVVPPHDAIAQNANWIWASQHQRDDVPIGPTHYRKSFQLASPEVGELVIAADDDFQVYLNNQLIGYGTGFDELTKINLTPYLVDGQNVMAIRATNTDGRTAAMTAVMRFRLQGEDQWRWLATDESWKSGITVTPNWKNVSFDDSGWPGVQILGTLGTTKPWDNARLGEKPDVQQPDASSTDPGKSFRVPDHFKVQRILDSSIGSLICMEFNEFGQLILSREGGQLLLADMSNSENGEITIKKYCDEMENVQGILPLNGDVFVTGSGPQGTGLYRLSDSNQDGKLEPIQLILKFRGEPGEHGPHGLVLGPDGMIYVSVGNASGIDSGAHPASPVRNIYEGEVLPRMEDPGGHALGIKAPGGMILRVSIDGTRKEIFAAGIRNAYDLAFNLNGDLFVHDSDMESDIGTPWYRPNQVYHLTAGGEYGWRSGSAKFPYYFIDNLPGIADTGRGSPTGAVVYDHVMMPLSYHGALFSADWSEGRILAIHLKQNADSYVAEVEEFLKAEPLTVTDLAVGPDGALYFCTGGRGTQGSVYRVSWAGEVPDSFSKLEDRLSQLVRRPQPQSAWSRQQIARLKTVFENSWSQMLNGILLEKRNISAYRIRALNIMLLYGPIPGDETLISLAKDPDPLIRARAIGALAWRTTKASADVLMGALTDEDIRVRRAACEALTHTGGRPTWEQIEPLLRSTSRTEAFAARRVLETMEASTWREQALASENIRVFMTASTALMIIQPDLKNAYDILAKASAKMDGFVADSDFVDLLRVIQLALVRGKVDPAKIPLFHERIANEFPSGNGTINRELSRVLGFLNISQTGERLTEYLASHSDSDSDKLQVLVNLKHMASQFDGPTRLAAIDFLERIQTQTTIGNYSLHVLNVLKEFTDRIEDDQITEILKNGSKWPSSALAAFFNLPNDLADEQIEWIIEIDRNLKDRQDSPALRARIGCVATLARTGNEKAMYYLREVWRHEPNRRNDVALGLAQQPDGPNWPYLISSLEQLSDDSARDVLENLVKANRRPREPKYYRQVIIVGYRLRENGAAAAGRLLQHWTDHQIAADPSNWQHFMKQWAKWFNETYPDESPVFFEDENIIGKYSVDQLLTYMERSPKSPDLHNGSLLFTKAQCNKCHRFNNQGEPLGPELTTIARRFSRRETLRSILHPSEVISDQYQTKKVSTVDGQMLLGLLSEADDDTYVILDSDGNKTRIAKSEIEEIQPAESSSMPDGLLDTLSMQEIYDLMSYLYSQDQQIAQTPVESR